MTREDIIAVENTLLQVVERLDQKINSVENSLDIQKKEYDSVLEKILLEKESSRNDISIIFTKFFVVFISMCFGYILFGSIASGFGLDVKLTESINALLEPVKIAVFPLAMLIFGFHFGTNSSASLKKGMLGILEYLKKQSEDNEKTDKSSYPLQGNG